jgi:hypothetical protein
MRFCFFSPSDGSLRLDTIAPPQDLSVVLTMDGPLNPPILGDFELGGIEGRVK